MITSIFKDSPVRRVILIAPPDVEASLFSFATCKRGRYTNYEPYGLGMLAGRLRDIGIEIRILNLASSVLRAARLAERESDFDYDAVWRGDLADAVSDFQPDLVGVTCMFSQTHPMLVRVCADVAALAPALPIAVGGVHVTNALATPATRAALLADLPMVSLFFRHECDEAFPTFVRVVNGELPDDSLAQVLLRHGEEEADFSQRQRPGVETLDAPPAHDLMRPDELSRWGKVGAYFYMLPPETRFATVQSNRGCRAQCTFCSVRNFNGMGVRRRSPTSVADELEWLRDDFGVRHVMWLDDDFLYDKRATLALFDEMVRRNLGMTWDCTNGVIAASCDDEVVAAAAASGCICLSLGMESGNREILKRIKKPGTVENFLAAAEAIRKFPQIYSRVFLIIGFPGETFSQIADTVTVARQMGLDWYQIQLLQPLPNTPLFDSMVEDKLIKPEDFSGVRYAGGTFGKNAGKSAGGRDMLARDFDGVFSSHRLDEVPSPADMEDIWAYMVVHLNYLRLEAEDRPIKLEQYLGNLEYVSDVVAPGDALALHFRQHLLAKLDRPASPEIAARLRNLLTTQPYWQERFAQFGWPMEIAS
ncbi:B12-binding domain-containing radical SAM protein [Paramagnetospirillum kuznetsovii]|uniref:B12-binding domain-containing radical SAM protein n=1 Tax=Paramagnetospirillum kuznetsovii TaxID=2053833 RepID=UPI001374ED89|nr:radical SAM protein [Paramagnetospirillum kuznetsovii]